MKKLYILSIILLIAQQLQAVVVTTTADEVPAVAGSLRQAIIDANNDLSVGLVPIDFNIPESDPGLNKDTGCWLIIPTEALPPIVRPVVIDGTTQPAATFPIPTPPIRIELSGQGYTFDQNIFNDGPALPYGLVLAPGSDGSTIKGLLINLFVGLPEDFLRIAGAGIHIESSNNHIIQNFFGTSCEGKKADEQREDAGVQRANAAAVQMVGPGAFGNTIGSSNPKERNIISGSRYEHGAVRISSGAHDNRVIGNYINLDCTGKAVIGETAAGVMIEKGSFENCIGGEEPGEGNVISGCTYWQIGIYNLISVGFFEFSLNNKIVGNFLGIDACGKKALCKHSGDGISLTAGASGTIIKHNVISGVYRGIFAYQLIVKVDDLTICNNKIGTDASGKEILGNQDAGIHLQFSSGSVIKCNTVAGSRVGLIIDGQSSNNVVCANTICKNCGDGIQIGSQAALLTENNQIGGPGCDDKNVICDNQGNGICITYFTASDTTVENNEVKENDKNGIKVLVSSNHLINGNCITKNGCAGVLIDDLGAQVCETEVSFAPAVVVNPATGVPQEIPGSLEIIEKALAAVSNKIICNSIADNDKSGIQLGKNNQAECGPNRLQEAPEITSVVRSKKETVVSGTLTSEPLQRYLIQLFANQKDRNPLELRGITEGKKVLVSFEVVTNGAGFAPFEVTLCNSFKFISATATRLTTCDTSEFSNNK